MKHNMYCDCCGWYWNAAQPEHGTPCPNCGCYGTIDLTAADADHRIQTSIDNDTYRETYE